MLDEKTIEALEHSIMNGTPVEVKIEKGQFVVVELGRKLKSTVPIEPTE